MCYGMNCLYESSIGECTKRDRHEPCPDHDLDLFEQQTYEREHFEYPRRRYICTW